ncbi:hypothetical protein GF327_02195 [Candidatus Woesearchaeota archaeon]|nr:hypothetical protein [Candidatus Woesearchaeota archaeon]
MKKRGSVFLTAFIITVALGLFLVVNYDSGTDSGNEQISNIQQSSESLSSFIYNTIEDSSLRGSLELASDWKNKGYFISYSLPNAPGVDEVKGELSEKVKSIINLYFEELENTDNSISAVSFEETGRIDTVEILVDAEGVANGEYDENFRVRAVTDEDDDEFILSGESGEQSYNYPDFELDIENWRFWYLYRKINEWIIPNSYPIDICSNMPLYGILGSEVCCNYKALSKESGKKMLEDAVNNLQNSFDEDNECVYNCFPQDPDCTGETGSETGTCNQDNFCDETCNPRDPDCFKCTYVECNYEILCDESNAGDSSITTEMDPEISADCPEKTNDCTGEPSFGNICKGECVQQSCKYVNDQEEKCNVLCEDNICPNIVNPPPPCIEGEVNYNGGNYTGKSTDPKICLGFCKGKGVKYYWSQIAEITCTDILNKKPLNENNFVPLSFKFKVHTYFSRMHPAPGNTCEYGNCLSCGGNNNNAGVAPSPPPTNPEPPSPPGTPGSGS